MDLLTILKILLRRWYVVAPVLVLTGAAAVGVRSNTPPEFEATGWLILESPELDARRPSIDLVSLADNIRDDRPGDLPSAAEFVVRANATSGSSMISVAAPSADAAERAANVIADALAQQVQQRQADAGVEEDARLLLRRVAPRHDLVPGADGSFMANLPLEIHDPMAGVQNPYGANPDTANLLRVTAMGDSGHVQFAEATDGDVDFAVGTSRDAPGLLQVQTSGGGPEAVLEAFYTVQDILDGHLDERQARAQVPESRRIEVAVLDAPLEAMDVSPPIDRATAGVVLLGGLLALGLAMGLHSLSESRRAAASSGGDTDAPYVSRPSPQTGAKGARHPSESRPDPSPSRDTERTPSEASRQSRSQSIAPERTASGERDPERITPGVGGSEAGDDSTRESAGRPGDVLTTRDRTPRGEQVEVPTHRPWIQDR